MGDYRISGPKSAEALPIHLIGRRRQSDGNRVSAGSLGMAGNPSPFLPVRPDWLALHAEPAADPTREIVDPHHHLWDRPDDRYLFHDLLADTNQGHRIVQTVYVQCRSMYRADGPVALRPVGEIEFVRGVAAMSASGQYGELRACAAIVGHADLALGDAVAPVLEALAEAAGGRLAGIRHPVAWHDDPAVRSSPVIPPPGVLLDEQVRRGIARLAPAGLSLDVWAYHTQLDEVFAIAELFSDLVLVIDHVGGPLGVGRHAGRRNEVFAEWRVSMARLAALPNVFVKLGGLGMRVGGFAFDERDRPATSRELADAWRPYIVTCIDLFAPERCMFQSNFPVDKGMYGYGVMWNAFKRLAHDYSEAEKAALFAGTARRVYKLPAL